MVSNAEEYRIGHHLLSLARHYSRVAPPPPAYVDPVQRDLSVYRVGLFIQRLMRLTICEDLLVKYKACIEFNCLLVHRLDRESSGLLLMGRTKEKHKSSSVAVQ
ncbi:hypothetical protein V6N13_144381 [Hibiscus sabdariffa]|uniref:Uncharacterized protein n=1 Tax=Hibiscus sabdariffa TaxID=183260 RepID=A0ABR2FK80_9ROSI